MKAAALIVDDNSTNLYMLEALLKGNGFEVVTVKNGKEALEAARAVPPDIVISDILMPVMDGYKLCHEWKADDKLKNIPLIFYTATYTDPKDEVFALSLGADRFIIKPQDPVVLVNIIQDVLNANAPVKRAPVKPLGEEMEYFRQYNKILFSKLEKKMSDLEASNRNLSILEERYRLSFEYASDIIFTVDTDLSVSSISPSIKKILGYKPEEIAGKTITGLQFLFTEEALVRAINDIQLSLKGEQIFSAIYQCRTYSGTLKHIEVNLAPTLKENAIVGIIAVARDIEDRKHAEDKIRSLLHEKSVLLKEAHHRIKNNMNTLMGLLILQLEAQKEPSCIAVLKAAMSRLETMRILYDKLYLLEYQNEMSAGEYLTSLVEEIVKMFSSNSVLVQTRIKIDNFILGVQLLPPVGIIVNEIITNIMKYAFKGRERGLIIVNGSIRNEHVVLSVEDDGIGIPDSVDIHNPTGSGLILIKMIAMQIKGTLRIERGNGTKIILEFPL